MAFDKHMYLWVKRYFNPNVFIRLIKLLQEIIITIMDSIKKATKESVIIFNFAKAF